MLLIKVMGPKITTNFIMKITGVMKELYDLTM